MGQVRIRKSRAAATRFVFGYALDHWRYVLPTLLGLALSLSVFALAATLSSPPYHAWDVTYAALLALIGLVFGLSWDALARYQDRMRLERIASVEDVEQVTRWLPPAHATTADAEQCFAAIRACDRAWRNHQASTQERVFFYTTLAARAVHSMKTPLQALALLVQAGEHAAQDGRLEREWPELARRAWAELRRLDGLVSQVLHSVRLEDFARDLVPERVSLPALAREVINAFKHDWVIRGIYPRLEIDGDPETYTVFTDRKWLRLILEQVTRNALQYGRSSFTVRLARDGEDAGFRLEMRDDGEGMPPEDLARACEPFYTGAQGRKVATATGIGLYLAREAANRLGLRLSLSSWPGGGTTVTLTFPRAQYFAPEHARLPG
ncbi:HAMP domain-containing histidine kinase [Thermomicrobiaceae bacterium CFH 74404]|uniref:histidine kinase n=1 Tax=Thermalbibacter longus TaxID=2951981 RepID=A0AA42BBL8_9BACT|nr:HAMP domain-containing sensor histidine kinase [Thermalbibacter longus]MCM8747933.1 HAMP domain-containing histidine kinase [Thermalbibacter longus]